MLASVRFHHLGLSSQPPQQPASLPSHQRMTSLTSLRTTTHLPLLGRASSRFVQFLFFLWCVNLTEFFSLQSGGLFNGEESDDDTDMFGEPKTKAKRPAAKSVTLADEVIPPAQANLTKLLKLVLFLLSKQTAPEGNKEGSAC